MKDFILYMIAIISVLTIILFFIMLGMAYPLTLVGQYTVSNYTSQDGQFKMFLLSKDKLNFTVLENENDITDKLLVIRVHGFN